MKLMKQAFAAALALGCCMALTVPAAQARDIEAKVINSGHRTYKQFTLDKVAAGSCDIEEGGTINYYPDGRLKFDAVIQCDEPYQSSYGFTKYNHSRNGRWDNDLELEAKFRGLDHHFDEEFDADLNVTAISSAQELEEGTYRYRWTENRPSNRWRRHEYDNIDRVYTRLD